ncbi:MAG: ParB/RepB/Spo0J family partition protein [Candidatus Kaiserbacteria bacterium]|nr:ParB/RepB/Spo0J family partition protein [Candidatus Kaiserbacteria bacterium]
MNYERPSSLSVFWVSLGKIDPNPYQPRKVFSEESLVELAQSIRQYGILQPLVVTKKESMGDGGAMTARYELIAGERRLRAAEIAGIDDVPVIIRSDELDNMARLELAIIENLQREDLNPVDRARAFTQLINEFSVSRADLANRMGRSKEYISNTTRILSLPEHMLDALSENKMKEGHTRPLLMLVDRPDEQEALFQEIIKRRITVRDSEAIARRQAADRARKQEHSPRVMQAQSAIEGILDTRVQIRTKGDEGGRILIDYFSDDDLDGIIEKLQQAREERDGLIADPVPAGDVPVSEGESSPETSDDDDVYTFKNFSL